MVYVNFKFYPKEKLLYYEIHAIKKKIFATIRKETFKNLCKAVKFMEKEEWNINGVFEVYSGDPLITQQIWINRLCPKIRGIFQN